MHKTDGKNWWHEATINNKFMKATASGRQNLGRCYNRYDTTVTSDSPITEKDVRDMNDVCHFAYGQGSDIRKISDNEFLVQDFVDSSD